MLHYMHLNWVFFTLFFISLKCLVLEVLWSKFKGIPLIESERSLMLLFHAYLKLEFLIWQKNAPNSFWESILPYVVRIIFYFNKCVHLQDLKPLSGIQYWNKLKSIINIYLWPKVLKMVTIHETWANYLKNRRSLYSTRT